MFEGSCSKNTYLILTNFCFFYAVGIKLPFAVQFVNKASSIGCLKVLKWLKENGCPWDTYTGSYAASNGHIEILKWLKEYNCPWDRRMNSCAARNGQLETLRWLLENDRKFFENSGMKFQIQDPIAAWEASRYGHLNCLILLKEYGYRLDSTTFTNAMLNGDLNVLRWLKENNCEYLPELFRFATKFNPKILPWLKENY